MVIFLALLLCSLAVITILNQGPEFQDRSFRSASFLAAAAFALAAALAALAAAFVAFFAAASARRGCVAFSRHYSWLP
jgi:hypothetical protein